VEKPHYPRAALRVSRLGISNKPSRTSSAARRPTLEPESELKQGRCRPQSCAPRSCVALVRRLFLVMNFHRKGSAAERIVSSCAGLERATARCDREIQGCEPSARSAPIRYRDSEPHVGQLQQSGGSPSVSLPSSSQSAGLEAKGRCRSVHLAGQGHQFAHPVWSAPASRRKGRRGLH